MPVARWIIIYDINKIRAEFIHRIPKHVPALSASQIQAIGKMVIRINTPKFYLILNRELDNK